MTTDYKSGLPAEDRFRNEGKVAPTGTGYLDALRKMDLYARQREVSAGRKSLPSMMAHHANSNLHIGHALNKILKDVISGLNR